MGARQSSGIRHARQVVEGMVHAGGGRELLPHRRKIPTFLIHNHDLGAIMSVIALL